LARADWDYVSVRKEVLDRAKKFTDTPEAKGKGLGSARELITDLLLKFLDENDEKSSQN